MVTECAQHYIDLLKSEECYCGGTKEKLRSFCYGCYMALPKDLRGNLWVRLRQGYEENYEEACAWLEEHHL